VRCEPYHDWHRFSVSLDDHACRPRAQHAGVERGGQARDFGRECGEAVADRDLEGSFFRFLGFLGWGSGTPDYDAVAFWSSDSETGSPWSGAIVFTSSFNCWMLRYKLTLFA